MTAPPRRLLLGCGILRREVEFLMAQRGWDLDTHFLPSSLHNYLVRLGTQLDRSLQEASERDVVVLYGACHPRMEAILQDHHTHRTAGQNCVVQLLGDDLFMEELSQGAYFLLEAWARTWEPMIRAAFGPNPQVIREIFHSSHKYMLALRTPCSGDFTAAAEAAARFVDLPLQWREVSLDRLEAILEEALAQPGEG